jgi:hypothetical protein
MRDLHAALAHLHLWEASWRAGGVGDPAKTDARVSRLVTEAARHLGARGLVRDPRQIWRPVLGSPQNLPGRTST